MGISGALGLYGIGDGAISWRRGSAELEEIDDSLELIVTPTRGGSVGSDSSASSGTDES